MVFWGAAAGAVGGFTGSADVLKAADERGDSLVSSAALSTSADTPPSSIKLCTCGPALHICTINNKQ